MKMDLFSLGLAGSMAFSLSQFGSFFQARRVMTQMKIQAAVRKSVPVTEKSGIEAAISVFAKTSGVKKLVSIGNRSGGNGREIQIDWEAGQAATLKFLSDLNQRGVVGRCVKLQLSFTRGSAIFEMDAASLPQKISAQDLKLALARDVFAPLWVDAPAENKPVICVVDRKKEAEASRQEQERQRQEQSARQEAQRIEMKRQRLQSFSVTGIVNNGREALAFVNAGPSTPTMTLHKGDVVEDAQVVSIDDSRNEVQLDYAGKVQVVLKLK